MFEVTEAAVAVAVAVAAASVVAIKFLRDMF